MSKYLEMLKDELNKISDTAHPPTAKTVKRPFGSKGSAYPRGFPENKNTFDSKDSIPPGTSRENFRAQLDDGGRLRTNGLIPDGCTMLGVLVSLGASVEEIERHIHPIGSPGQWEQWTGERIAGRLHT